jgi:hypothetical protein
MLFLVTFFDKYLGNLAYGPLKQCYMLQWNLCNPTPEYFDMIKITNLKMRFIYVCLRNFSASAYSKIMNWIFKTRAH